MSTEGLDCWDDYPMEHGCVCGNDCAPPPLPLDPTPWQVYAEGVDGWRRNHHRERFTNAFGEVVFDRFAPRPGFSQNKEDYA